MLVSDYVHPTPHGGHCRIRIFESASDDLPVVVCTEPDDNAGMSITNAAEYIAAAVLAQNPEIFDPFSLGSVPGVGYDKPMIWIEHYQTGARGTPEDAATFDIVEFSHYEPRAVLRAGEWGKEIGEPSWMPATRQEAEALAGEAL
jgi:hypothetical protein